MTQNKDYIVTVISEISISAGNKKEASSIARKLAKNVIHKKVQIISAQEKKYIKR